MMKSILPLLPVFLTVFYAFFTISAYAETVQNVESGDTLRLANGAEVHMRGIALMDEAAAQKALAEMVTGRDITLSHAMLDRYGRTEADVSLMNEKKFLWPAEELVRQGLAFAFVPLGDEARLENLLKAENEARAQKRGVWSHAEGGKFEDVAADSTEDAYGEYAFVRGTVVSVARIKNMYYLNFGEDYRRDFTVSITAGDARTFKKANIDILEFYKGKNVRVRGWVKRRGGPMINVTHPAEIETLK